MKHMILSGAVPQGWRHFFIRFWIVFVLTLTLTTGCFGHSVLTHEEIVDLVWTTDISPMLLTRFPYLTADQIREAHGYAYGGAVIQDLGYYPFGSTDFSDLEIGRAHV